MGYGFNIWYVCFSWQDQFGGTKVFYSLKPQPQPLIYIDKLEIKYNNAKRSIPAHPTFVNDAPRDLHL